MIENTTNLSIAVEIIRDLLEYQSWADDAELTTGVYIGIECRYCEKIAICAGDIEHPPTCPVARGEALVRKWDEQFRK